LWGDLVAAPRAARAPRSLHARVGLERLETRVAHESLGLLGVGARASAIGAAAVTLAEVCVTRRDLAAAREASTAPRGLRGVVGLERLNTSGKRDCHCIVLIDRVA
jgi:hypothetical protein